MAPLWHLYFTSIKGKYFSFRYQSGILGQFRPPSTRRTAWWRLPHCQKYSHRLDHCHRYDINLFLIPLILNFLNATISSFLSYISMQMFVCGRTWVCGLGYIICFLLSMVEDTNYLFHNWIVREYGGFSFILPYTTVEISWFTLKTIYYFHRGSKKQPSIYHYWR